MSDRESAAMGAALRDDGAVDLLRGLVSIPSLSGGEAAAVRWLVGAMGARGLVRTEIDEAGNAVGEIGAPDAPRTIVLLGHIDTVPGLLPVRLHRSSDGDTLLYGRGTVDAKGPLAAFVAASGRLGDDWARDRGLRVVVVGAVEEEAATSKGARFVARRFDGRREPVPTACIIGEPSRWHRLTLGYKGRLLVGLEAERPCAHTAGPDFGIATAAVALWNRIESVAAAFNAGLTSPFAQLLPSLRELSTTSDGLIERVRARCGLRLPLDYDPRTLIDELIGWARELTGVDGWRVGDVERPAPGERPRETWRFAGEGDTLRLDFDAYEQAWLASRDTDLVRSFTRAVRDVGRETAERARPGLLSKTGTSDLNVVAPLWRCPILAYGPGDSALDHTPDEHVSLDEYLKAVRVLELGLENLAACSAGDGAPPSSLSS